MAALKILADSRLWALAAGLSLGLLWHGYSVRGLELDLAAERERKQQVVIEYREREAVDNGQNVADWNEGEKRGQDEIDNLRNKLSDGAIALRLCKADTVRATVQASNSRAAEEDARADQRRFEEDVLQLIRKAQTQDNWVESAYEFINRDQR